jgi:hypothetical protein
MNRLALCTALIAAAVVMVEACGGTPGPDPGPIGGSAGSGGSGGGGAGGSGGTIVGGSGGSGGTGGVGGSGGTVVGGSGGSGGTGGTGGSGGSDGGLIGPFPIGSWEFMDPTANTYIFVILKADGTFETLAGGVAASNVVAIQEETGTYSISGANLTITPEQFSCPKADPPRSYTFAMDSGSLALTNSSGTIVYPPNPPSTTASSLVIVLGCFESSGFVTYPLTTVSDD